MSRYITMFTTSQHFVAGQQPPWRDWRSTFWAAVRLCYSAKRDKTRM